MKKLIYLFLGCALMTSISCSSDDDSSSDNNNSAENGVVKAKIDGTSYASTPMGTQASRVDANGGTTVVITSNDLASGRNLTFTMNTLDGLGTYDIGGDNSIFIVVSYIETDASDLNNVDVQTWSAPFEGGEKAGEVTLTELSDTKVMGTFYFTGKNSENGSSKEITEGSFNIDLTAY